MDDSHNLFNPTNYFLSGGVETAYLFIGKVLLYAAMNVHGPGLAVTKHGIVRGYIDKKAAQIAKDNWLTMSPELVQQMFDDWKKKWLSLEPELYGYVSSESFDWRSVLERLDKINSEFWQESYSIEATDPFANELETIILTGLAKAGISKTLLHELMTPAEATRTQLVDIELEAVRQHIMKPEEYVRKYWYRNATWNGGHMLRTEDVEALMHTKEEQVSTFDSLRTTHTYAETVLDDSVKDLLHLLRVLTLWREERKAIMQQICIGLQRVVDVASVELGVDPNVIRWSLPEEVAHMPKNHIQVTQERERASLVIGNGQDAVATVLIGKEAESLLKPFFVGKVVADIMGTVASPGKATGRARIVLGAKDFAKFLPGEVLVTNMTRPEFFPLMRQAAAIVTDEGGLICHAAIVSRELKKPCVVGTKHATQQIKDGDMVEVRANHGMVRILS